MDLLLDKFYDNVIVPEKPNGCLLWKETVRNDDGTVIYVGMDAYPADLFSFNRFVEPDLRGRVIHRCGDSRCVHPDHLSVMVSS